MDEDEEWEQCDRCGWWVYLGEDVPDKFRLCWEFVPDDCISGGDILLCMRCEEAEYWQECSRIHFRYCVGVKGFNCLDKFQCTKCAAWGGSRKGMTYTCSGLCPTMSTGLNSCALGVFSSSSAEDHPAFNDVHDCHKGRDRHRRRRCHRRRIHYHRRHRRVQRQTDKSKAGRREGG